MAPVMVGIIQIFLLEWEGGVIIGLGRVLLLL